MGTIIQGTNSINLPSTILTLWMFLGLRPRVLLAIPIKVSASRESSFRRVFSKWLWALTTLHLITTHEILKHIFNKTASMECQAVNRCQLASLLRKRKHWRSVSGESDRKTMRTLYLQRRMRIWLLRCCYSTSWTNNLTFIWCKLSKTNFNSKRWTLHLAWLAIKPSINHLNSLRT